MASVAVVITREQDRLPLVSTGLPTARMHQAVLHVFFITQAEQHPTWFGLPAGYDSDDIQIHTISGAKSIQRLIKQLATVNPLILGMAINAKQDERYLAGDQMEPVLRHVKCPVYLVKSAEGWSLPDSLSAFVPFWDDANTRFAIRTALELSPKLNITAAKVVAPTADQNERQSQIEEFQSQTREWEESGKFQTKLLYSFDEQQALLQEASGYDFLLTGVGRGNRITRTILGDFRNKLIGKTTGPAIIVREYQGKTGALLFKGWAVFDNLTPTLTREDRIEAYRMIRRGGRPTRDFYSMIVLSAAIAALGLILDSAAVIIGAMLVAPLMSAIIGMGMAIIHGDMKFLSLTSKAAVFGASAAILTGFVLGLINFYGETTYQMLLRTNPTILDLVVALISGVAAAYALCRKNVSSSLPGVAIAVALVPPLATVGVCLSIGFWGLAWGAFKLFLSNMVAIVFASALVFSLFGFRPNVDALDQERRIKVFKRSIIATGTLVVLVLALLITQTVTDFTKAAFDDDVQNELSSLVEDLGMGASIDDWRVTAKKDGAFQISVLLKSTKPISREEIEVMEEKLGQSLRKPVSLDLDVIPLAGEAAKSE